MIGGRRVPSALPTAAGARVRRTRSCSPGAGVRRRFGAGVADSSLDGGSMCLAAGRLGIWPSPAARRYLVRKRAAHRSTPHQATVAVERSAITMLVVRSDRDRIGDSLVAGGSTPLAPLRCNCGTFPCDLLLCFELEIESIRPASNRSRRAAFAGDVPAEPA